MSGMAETKAAKAATPDKAPAAAPEDTAPAATSTTPEPVKPGDQSQPAPDAPAASGVDAAASTLASTPAPDAAPAVPAEPAPAEPDVSTPEGAQSVVEAANEKKVSENRHAIRRIERILLGVTLNEDDLDELARIVQEHAAPGLLQEIGSR